MTSALSAPYTTLLVVGGTPTDGTNTRLEVVFSYNIRFGLLGKIVHKLIMRGKLEKSLPETLLSVKKRIETGESIRPLLTVAAAI